MTTSPDPFRGVRYPAEVIQHAVWLYHLVSLSLRDVELILVARGVVVSYESIREWGLHFGRLFANELQRRWPRRVTSGTWVRSSIRIRGEQHYLWRAVDQDGKLPAHKCRPAHDLDPRIGIGNCERRRPGRHRVAHLHRQEHRPGGAGYRKAPLSQLPPPVPQQATVDVEPPRHLRRACPQLLRLGQHAQLVLIAPASPPLHAGDDLHPAPS